MTNGVYTKLNPL